MPARIAGDARGSSTSRSFTHAGRPSASADSRSPAGCRAGPCRCSGRSAAGCRGTGPRSPGRAPIPSSGIMNTSRASDGMVWTIPARPRMNCPAGRISFGSDAERYRERNGGQKGNENELQVLLRMAPDPLARCFVLRAGPDRKTGRQKGGCNAALRHFFRPLPVRSSGSCPLR